MEEEAKAQVNCPPETLSYLLSNPSERLNYFRNIGIWKLSAGNLLVPELQETFPNARRILKTRNISAKTGQEIPLSVHFDLAGIFIKIADDPSANGRIEKEFRCWQIALEVFEEADKVELRYIRHRNPNNRKPYQNLAYLVMPDMGLPLNYLEQISPGFIPQDAIHRFIDKMVELVESGLEHHDLNPGNIVVRMLPDGSIRLFPIDWESGNKITLAKRPEAAERIRGRCARVFYQYQYKI